MQQSQITFFAQLDSTNLLSTMKVFGFVRSLALAAGKVFCCCSSSRKIKNVETKPLLTTPEVSAMKVKDDLHALALNDPKKFLEVMVEAKKDQILALQLESIKKKKSVGKIDLDQLIAGSVIKRSDFGMAQPSETFDNALEELEAMGTVKRNGDGTLQLTVMGFSWARCGVQ